MVLGHEASNSSDGRVFAKTGNLAVALHSVIFQCLQGDGLIDTLDLLWLCVDLLLALLTASTETKDQVEGGLLLDVVVTQSAAIFQLLSSKDKTLLIRRDSLLVLDLGLHIVDGVGWLYIQGNCLTCVVGSRENRNGVRSNYIGYLLKLRRQPTTTTAPLHLQLYCLQRRHRLDLPVRVFTKICILMCYCCITPYVSSVTRQQVVSTLVDSMFDAMEQQRSTLDEQG